MYQGAWGERPLDTHVSHDLKTWAIQQNAKILLARTPKDIDPYPESTFLFSTSSGSLLQGTLNAVGIPDLEFTQVSKPMLLICTNGKRDQCCATFGRNLVNQVKDLLSPDLFGHVLECSHLGGHRFAPTAIWLPENLVLGRLEPTAAAGLVEHGAIASQFIRGKTQLMPAQQVVHAALWPEKPEFIECEQNGTDYHITALVNGAKETFSVATNTVDMVVSCGADPKSNTRHEIVGRV